MDTVSYIFLVLIGVVLVFFACMLNDWLPNHIKKKEVISIDEVLDTHGSTYDSKVINPVRFWRLPARTVLNASCTLCCLFAVVVAFCHGSTDFQILLWVIWGIGLVVLAFVDAQTMILSDMLTLPLLGIGLLMQLWPESRSIGLEMSVFGVVVGFVPLWLLAQGYRLLRQREGIGLGDLKLLVAMGAWSGPLVLPQVLLLAALLAIAVFVLERFICNSGTGFHEERPFGPAIVAAYFIVLLFTM